MSSLPTAFKYALSITLVSMFVIYDYIAKTNHVTERNDYKPVEFHSITRSINAQGKIEARRTIEVGAQVSGEVRDIYVSVGDKVVSRQLLIEIDPIIALSELKSAENELAQLKADVDLRKFMLDYANKEFKRVENMYLRGAVTLDILNEKEVAVETAKNNLTAGIISRDSAKVQVETKKAQLQYTTIMSPITGTVVALLTDEGQTLVSTQQVSPLLKIADTSQLLVKLPISEVDISDIKEGMTVEYNLLNDTQKKYKSEITKVDIIPSDEVTNRTSYNVYFEIGDDIDIHQLRLGMTVKARIIQSRKKRVLAIPVHYITPIEPGIKGTVLVLKENGVIEHREVTLGMSDLINVEIVNGLKLNEKVVWNQ